MSELFFQTNFNGISSYETDVTQDPITKTVIEYLTPSTGLRLNFKPNSVAPIILAPTSGVLSPIATLTVDTIVRLADLTATPSLVGKFYPSPNFLPVQLPTFPSGNYTVGIITKPKPVSQTYYVNIYSVPSADAIADTTYGSPPIGSLIKQTNHVTIPATTNTSSNVLTFTTIRLPEIYTNSFVFSASIYAYGSGDFEMVVGDTPITQPISHISTPIPNII